MTDEQCIGCGKRPEVYGSPWCSRCHDSIPRLAQEKLIKLMNFDLERMAEEVIGHIDTMYPQMWRAVTPNARRSVRGTILNNLRAGLCP